jgi:hypothetical protein
MVALRTFKELRKYAAPQDRNVDALALPAAPPYTFQKAASQHYPTEELAALRALAGPLADAAVAEAKWSAVSVWVKTNPCLSYLTNRRMVAQLALRACREARWIMDSWPSLSGTPYVSLLTEHSYETEQAAWGICWDTLSDWEGARSPRFSGAIRRVTSYLRDVRKAQPSLMASPV